MNLHFFGLLVVAFGYNVYGIMRGENTSFVMDQGHVKKVYPSK